MTAKWKSFKSTIYSHGGMFSCTASPNIWNSFRIEFVEVSRLENRRWTQVAFLSYFFSILSDIIIQIIYCLLCHILKSDLFIVSSNICPLASSATVSFFDCKLRSLFFIWVISSSLRRTQTSYYGYYLSIFTFFKVHYFVICGFQTFTCFEWFFHSFHFILFNWIWI